MSFVTSKVKIKTGFYTGNDSVNRGIPHSLNEIPKYIIMTRNDGAYNLNILETGLIKYNDATTNTEFAVTSPDNINFYVGNAAQYPQSGNSSTIQYTWTAFTG